MTKLHGIKSSNPLVASMIAEQVFDNSLVAAGLMDDSRVMLPRYVRGSVAVVSRRYWTESDVLWFAEGEPCARHESSGISVGFWVTVVFLPSCKVSRSR